MFVKTGEPATIILLWIIFQLSVSGIAMILMWKLFLWMVRRVTETVRDTWYRG